MTQSTFAQKRIKLAEDRVKFIHETTIQSQTLEATQLRLEAEQKAIEALQAELDGLRRDNESIISQYTIDQDYIELNIGGTIVPTRKSTLLKKQKSLFVDILTQSKEVPRDKEGRIFIEMNPFHFSVILEYLRTDSLPILFSSDEEEREIMKDMGRLGLSRYSIPFEKKWNRTLKADDLNVSQDGKRIEVGGDDSDRLAIIGPGKIDRGTVTVSVKVIIPRPNRYSFGVLTEIPSTFNKGFAYKHGLLGWGLHDHQNMLGIYCQTQRVAESTLGYSTNDTVTMIVDVDSGSLTYKVNGVKCAELLNCEIIKLGVYIAVTLYNKGAVWSIVDD
ncbi:hypothetical protein BLNAU_2687 [Blattamonas nauphoetae]|uniref:Potassium channel tetramerisation-type BTB domain-containing protein n=1 Tax=Blattamonas nauphoetae TaxID=2049346 RepID=A0ABQ9YF93_9EUKA|nr:hypothetical protein BLNAU_2687 [Blattamonas nauphoetae]